MVPELRFRFRTAFDQVLRWLKRELELPAGPFANRMAPIRRGPKDRSGAAAVAEPDEELFTNTREWRRRKA